MAIIIGQKGGVLLSNRKRLWIILSCIVLIVGAFGYSYFTTLKRIINEVPEQKPGTRINTKNSFPPINYEEGVSKFPPEDIVTPSTLLIERTLSINTGCYIENQTEIPDELVNMTEDQVKEFYKDYESVEFSKEKIIISRKLPFLPNRFLVKLEDKYIKVFVTDSEGKASIYEEFPPVPCKNKDDELIKGIEVETLDEVWERIGDYE